jgi:hypothetical protein
MSLIPLYRFICFDELCLHVVEIISLTYANVMKMCTFQGSPKVHFFFLSDFLLLKILMREFFCKMVKLTNMLVDPRA